MPRLTQSVPKYRKHKASRQAIVEINGKRHYLGPHGTRASKLEYDRLVTEWLSSGRSTVYGVPEHQLSIAEMLVAYLTYAKKYYSDGPRSEYSQMVRTVRPLQQLYGRQPAREFNGLKLKAVREHYVAAGNCRPYVNLSVQRLIRVFRWAASEGLVPADIPVALGMVPGLRRGKTAAPEGRKVLPVERGVVAATLPYLSTVVRAMVELQQLTGMRPGEVVMIRPRDIDCFGDVWAYQPESHKTQHHGKDRTIYLGPQAQAVLRPFLLREEDDFCFSPAESVAELRAARTKVRKTPLYRGNSAGTNRGRHKPRWQPGKFYTTQSYGRALQRACDLAFPVPTELANDPQAAKIWRKQHRWSLETIRKV